MNAESHTGFILLLAFGLFLSATVPCGLIEAAVEVPCVEAPLAAEQAAEPAAQGAASLLPVDCCAECLACCVSYTDPPVLRPLTRAGTTELSSFSVEQGPLGSSTTIWRPPRV